MRWKICFVDHAHLALPLAYSCWFMWSYVYGLGVTVHAERINRLTTCTKSLSGCFASRLRMLRAMWLWILEPSATAPDFIPHPSSVWPHESDVLIAFLSFACCGDVSLHICVYTCVSSHNLDQEPRRLAFSRLLAAVSRYVCSPCGYCMEIASYCGERTYWEKKKTTTKKLSTWCMV